MAATLRVSFKFLYNKPNSTTEVADCLLSMEVSDDDDELVILLCTNTDPIETTETLNDEILVSATDVLAWDLPTTLTFPTIKVQTHRNRFVYTFSFYSISLHLCLKCRLINSVFITGSLNDLCIFVVFSAGASGTKYINLTLCFF